MNTTVPADPRLRKRAIAVVSITLLVGLVFLYFFHGCLRGVEVLATASPQLAVEKLNPIRNAARGVTLFSATALACLLGYVSLSVYRAGAVAAPRMACRLQHVDSHRTTGDSGSGVHVVSGSSGSRVWGGDSESPRAGAGGANRDTDEIGVGGLAMRNNFS